MSLDSEECLSREEKILSAKFVQIQLMPAEVATHPMALMALDENGHVWDYNFEHKLWHPLGTNRALPE